MGKVLLVHNIIAPQTTEFFNDLNDYLIKQGYDFLIVFLSANESIRKWDLDQEIKNSKFKFRVLGSTQLETGKKDKFYFHINKNFNQVLDEENPDIIIHAGWASLSAWQAQKWCKKHKKKYILWNESTKFENSWRRVVTKPIVKSLVKKSDGYISFGTRAKEYLEILGADPSKICEYYNPVGTDFFISEYKRLKEKKHKLKQKYGIKTKYAILFVGQLIIRKGVYEILEGFREFQKKNKDWSLIFVGGGQEQQKMEQIIKEQNIKNVYFPGFIQKNEIGELYTIADIFTLPSSEEVRGLVINEALCFGLPVITAFEVGASVDLVIEGKTGYVMKNHTPEEWYKGVNYIIDKDLIENNQSLEHISKFKNEKFIPNIKMFLD